MVDVQSIVAKTDWSKAQTIDVALGNDAFVPAELTLQRGQPYKIHLINGSDDTHTFSAAGFFKAVVLQKVVVNSAEKPNLSDDGVTLDEHQQADLYPQSKTPQHFCLGRFCLAVCVEKVGCGSRI